MRGHFGNLELFGPGLKRLACGLERVDEGFFREFLDDRFDNPSETEWHVTGQRYGSTFDDDIGITLLESPIRRESPKKSVTRIGL